MSSERRRRLRRPLCNGTAWACVLLWLTLEPAIAREPDLDRWVLGPLATYVATELRQYPRFKDASVQFVVMHEGKATAEVTELTLVLRDRLKQQVAGLAGTKVFTGTPVSGGDATSCQAHAQYLIGLELTVSPTGESSATVRALDVVEQTYVAGFRKRWQGRLNVNQRRQHRNAMLDRTFIGERTVPYAAHETDLMAAHLGARLRCELMRNVNGQYVLEKPAANADASNLDTLAELAANHLSGTATLSWIDDDEGANAILEGKAHPVDRDLHQYWLTLTPVGGASGLVPIATAVYVRLPGYTTAAVQRPASSPKVFMPQGTLLESTALVRLETDAACGRRTRPIGADSFRLASCWGLNVRTRTDAIVFILNHQQNRGLVRVGDRSCRAKTTARVARASEDTTIPLPADWLREQWAPQTRWEIEPAEDTYYALAVSDGKKARRLAALLDQLPQRCTASVRIGFAGDDLSHWLKRLSASFAEWRSEVDWKAIRVKSVY